MAEKKNTSHSRKTDELILIQFAEDQGFDHYELIEAVNRIKECHRKELQDYFIPKENEL